MFEKCTEALSLGPFRFGSISCLLSCLRGGSQETKLDPSHRASPWASSSPLPALPLGPQSQLSSAGQSTFVSFNIYLKGIDSQKGRRDPYTALSGRLAFSHVRAFVSLTPKRSEQEGASKVILPKPLRPEREVRVTGSRSQGAGV